MAPPSLPRADSNSSSRSAGSSRSFTTTASAESHDRRKTSGVLAYDGLWRALVTVRKRLYHGGGVAVNNRKMPVPLTDLVLSPEAVDLLGGLPTSAEVQLSTPSDG